MRPLAAGSGCGSMRAILQEQRSKSTILQCDSRVSLDRANRQRVVHHCHGDCRKTNGHTESPYGPESEDFSGGLRGECSDDGRLSCGLALGTYWRDPFVRWYLLDIPGDESVRKDNLVLCNSIPAGIASYNKPHTGNLHFGAFNNPTTHRIHRLGSSLLRGRRRTNRRS